MSRRLQVVRAVKAMIGAALPGSVIVGLDATEDAPARVGSGGWGVVQAGDPGEPDVDLSPLTYHYEHRIPIELLMADEDALDAAMTAIGAAITADRTLGGLCDWIEAEAATTEPYGGDGATRGAAFAVTASYATSSPLS